MRSEEGSISWIHAILSAGSRQTHTVVSLREGGLVGSEGTEIQDPCWGFIMIQ